MQDLMIFLSLCLLSSFFQGNDSVMLSNVTASMMKGILFKGAVTDMKINVENNSLLVLSSYALWNFDPVATNQQLIAGSTSTSLGYAEGVGEAAKFNKPRGLLVSENTAVVSDTLNHCLREVDLNSGQTSPLAGTCKSSGFKDGPANQAQFRYPYGLLNHKSGLLLAEWGNNAVRFVEGGAVSTIVSGSQVTRPTGLTNMDGQVFVTTDSGLLKLNLYTKTVELIAGHKSKSGFSDGPLLSSQFYVARGSVSPAHGLILIADYGNHRLRLVNLGNQQDVSSICTGVWGREDGKGDECRLYRPWSIVVFGETIYVGQANGRIWMLPLQSFPEVCPRSTIRAHLSPDKKFAEVQVSDATLILPEGHFVFQSELPDGTICVTHVNMED